MAEKHMDFRVVGVTCAEDDDGNRLYPGNIHRIHGIVKDRYNDNGAGLWSALDSWDEGELLGDPLPARLIRNPENPHDENAIEVHVPVLGRRGTMIGHVDRELASRLAPRLDSGLELTAVVKAVYVHPENPDNPGIDIRLTRVVASEAA